MTASEGDTAGQFRDRLLANETAFGLDLDQRFLVYGGSEKGEAAFIPTGALSRQASLRSVTPCRPTWLRKARPSSSTRPAASW